MLLELLVEVFAHSNVLEHALQFRRVLEATRLLLKDRSEEMKPHILNASFLNNGAIVSSHPIISIIRHISKQFSLAKVPYMVQRGI